MKVYIVIGLTGEYSDKYEWLVKGFISKDKAKSFQSKCTEFAEEYEKFLATESYDDLSYTEKTDMQQAQISNSPDEYFTRDYTGTFYNISEVEVEEEVE